MTESIRRAVICSISESFGLPVYGQTVPQGGQRPCFTVEISGVEQQRLLGRRCRRKVMFWIRYYSGEGKTAAADSLAAADGLYEALLLIGNEEKFAASSMKHEKTEYGVAFTAAYEYHILFDEEEDALMMRLEHNGRRAVGYEERSGI